MVDPDEAIDDQLTRASLQWKGSFFFERVFRLSFSPSKETQHKNEACHDWEPRWLRGDLSTLGERLPQSLTPIK